MGLTDQFDTHQVSWKASSLAAAAIGGILARKVSGAIWNAVSSSDLEPPLNPADRRVDWGDAVVWAIAGGVGAGLGRLVSQRAAAAAWESAVGQPPPGVVT